MKIDSAFFALSLCAALAGCGDPVMAAAACPSTSPSFAMLNSTVIVNSCALSASCHKAIGKMGGLDLETDPYHALVNAGTTCMPPCNGAKLMYPTRVVPGDPTKSFMYALISMPTATDAMLGDRMPQITAPLPAATIKEFECWIAAGALNN